MVKYFTFSIWGDNPKYTIGAIRNAQLAQKLFPDWKCIFYYDSTVPFYIINVLKNFDNVETIENTDGSFGAFWRFDLMFENDDVILSRDTDSRLSEREKILIEHWLNSNANYMVIRDHHNHYEFPILAGMWGKKEIALKKDFKEIMDQYRFTKQYTVDQIFLRDIVWPSIQYEKTSIYGVKEVEWMRETYDYTGKNFIGQTYSENDEPLYDGNIDG